MMARLQNEARDPESGQGAQPDDDGRLWWALPRAKACVWESPRGLLLGSSNDSGHVQQCAGGSWRCMCGIGLLCVGGGEFRYGLLAQNKHA